MKEYPRNIFQEQTFRKFERSLRCAQRIVLFLDYDGTLVPIRRTPEEAVIPQKRLALLNQLQQLPDTSIVIITGRALDDIRSLIGDSVQWIAANHGFHIQGPRREWIHPHAQVFAEQRIELLKSLHRSLSHIDGVRIEDKLYTMSIHYHQVAQERMKEVTKSLSTFLQCPLDRVRITRGKKVIEFRPAVEWGKGHAMEKVLSLMRLRTRPLIIAIGDDQTDESMFERLRRTEFGIRVGRGRHTSAHYCVRNVDEVTHLLETILNIQTDKRTFSYENT